MGRPLRPQCSSIETYQQEGGAIAVPDVLQPYMGGLKLIAAE
ncbi:MAG TPA: hypothetical protein VKY22_23660 [Bradyrhizobium sp.]|nr:hypothetical protein [Bradyrhizobium sp.]